MNDADVYGVTLTQIPFLGALMGPVCPVLYWLLRLRMGLQVLDKLKKPSRLRLLSLYDNDGIYHKILPKKPIMTFIIHSCSLNTCQEDCFFIHRHIEGEVAEVCFIREKTLVN
jgi:hypothetical protein